MGNDKENHGNRCRYAPKDDVTVPPCFLYSARTGDQSRGNRPCLAIDFEYIVNTAQFSPFDLVEGKANDIGDPKKTKSMLKERLDGHLVRRIEDGRGRTSSPTGRERQVERREGRSVNVLKGQFPPCEREGSGE